jgi:antitoxin Phd
VAVWQVQEAKARLSEVIERARTHGPQTITRHGEQRAVVLSIEDYHALIEHKPDFKAHLLGGPKVDDFSSERDRDIGRHLIFDDNERLSAGYKRDFGNPQDASR